MRSLLSLLFLFLSLVCYPQIPNDFIPLDNNDLSDAKFLITRYFKEKSLFGYMDGGAELYLEYGISDAVITELDLNNTFFKCEIFRMNGQEEAFGIFSVSRYRCQESPPLAPYTCQNSYQLQICKGRYYINIINRSGSETAQADSRRIGGILAGKISDTSFVFTEFINDTDVADIERNAVLAKGKLGLINGAPDQEDYFKDITGYCAMILPAGEKIIISVRFDGSEELSNFCLLHAIEPSGLSGSELKITDGESVKLFKKNHLIINFGY